MPVGSRLEKGLSVIPLCPLDGRVEDHEHVFCHCNFLRLTFETVCRCFGVFRTDNGVVMEPSRLVTDHTEYSLKTTQGLLVWSGIMTRISCEEHYGKKCQWDQGWKRAYL